MSLSKPQKKKGRLRYKHLNLIVEKTISGYQSTKRPGVMQIEVQNIRKLFGSLQSGVKSECIC